MPPAPFTIVTHNGEHHADEIFATALLKRYLAIEGREAQIIRSRDQAVMDAADALLDQGGIHDPSKLRFDHHSGPGVGKATAGLVFDFVQGKRPAWIGKLQPTINDIDQNDLRLGAPNPELSMALSAFNPTWEEKFTPEQGDEAFIAALGIVEAALKACENQPGLPAEDMNVLFKSSILNNARVVERLDAHEQSKSRGQAIFLEAAKSEDHGIVEIDNPGLPYLELFKEPDISSQPEDVREILGKILYVSFPTSGGGYGAIATPTPEDPNKQKLPFPQEWRGKRGQELVDAVNASVGSNMASLPDGKNPNGYFCHKDGFFLCGDDAAFTEVAMGFIVGRNLEARPQTQTELAKSILDDLSRRVAGLGNNAELQAAIAAARPKLGEMAKLADAHLTRCARQEQPPEAGGRKV